VADDDLLGIQEIAELLKLSHSEADALTKERTFPDPAEEVQRDKRTHNYWSRGEVENWAKENARLA
jgi:predicted DNA-binding transcriptional regulator AlpA